MEFPLALATMHNDNDRCYTDSDRHATYKIVDDELKIWVEPVAEWRTVREDVSELMKYNFDEVCDPSIFRYTFTEAIQLMKEGNTMYNTEYPSLVYTYDGEDGVERFATFNKSYNERENSTGFTADEIESKWAIDPYTRA